MSGSWKTGIGLARSLLIYRARPGLIPRLARFYADFLGPGDLAFDIGAHVGNRTHAMLRTGARVLALEPQRRFHDFLAKDLPSEARLLRLAAGPAPGRGRLKVSRLHPTVTSLAPDFAARMREAPGFRHVRWDDEEVVEITTLDLLIAEHGRPKLIKIDVEGYEADILEGLSQPIPLIAFEALPSLPGEALRALGRLGRIGDYRFNHIEGEGTRLSLAEWVDAGTMTTFLRSARRSGDVYARLPGEPPGT